jgi:hypothetical protein
MGSMLGSSDTDPAGDGIPGGDASLLPEQGHPGACAGSDGPTQAATPLLAVDDTRICFPFLNRGVCSFGAGCRFRHLAPDHPDAIADRVRTGHVFKIANLADEKVQAQLQEQLSAKSSPSAQALAPPTASSSDARICFPFLNHGRCDRESTCRFRHLAPDHPDAVADRMSTGAYDKIPAHANPFIEQNSNAVPGDFRICYTYLNRGKCDRANCSFRHLLPGHPDAIADRVRNGQLEKIPLYARAALARGGGPYSSSTLTSHSSPLDSYPMSGGMGSGLAGGSGRALPAHAGAPMGPPGMAQMAQLQAQDMGGNHFSSGGWGPLHLQPGHQAKPPSQAQMQQQSQQPQSMQQNMQPLQYQMQLSLQYPQQSLSGLQFPVHQYGAYRDDADLGHPSSVETRICFPFMNKGRCERGNMCRFRHLRADHPDAVADRARTGRVAGLGPSLSGIDAATSAISNMHLGAEGLSAYQSQVPDGF